MCGAQAPRKWRLKMRTLSETHLTSIPLFDKSAANDASGSSFLSPCNAQKKKAAEKSTAFYKACFGRISKSIVR
jgi:hypothetical protein